MPDNKRGYVQRGKGILPTDDGVADAYERRAKNDPILFQKQLQQSIIDALIQGSEKQNLRLHAVYFEPSHVHFLVSWTKQAGWLRIRRGLRHTVTLRLNERFGKRDWFSRGGSRKHVKDRAHFNHLMTTYRQKHQGLHWIE